MVRTSAKAFVLIQLPLYGRFLYLDLNGRGAESVPVKYAAIVLCLLFSLFWSGKGGDWLVTAALALTLGADTFLLLLDRDYWLGVLLFCGVQGIYLYKLCRTNGGQTLWPLRLGMFLLASVLCWRLELLTPLNLLVLFYFCNFLCNTLQSLRLPGRPARIFSAGLVLFLCCDLCVGAFNQPNLAPEALYSFASVGMWLFYLPAQALIALSGLPESILRGHDDENQ